MLEREELTSTQKLLLIGLKAIPDTSEGVSFADVAYYTSLSRKTVISNLKVLEDMKLLEVIREGTRQNRYIASKIQDEKGEIKMKFTLYKNGVYLKESNTIKELSVWLENLIGGSLYQGLTGLRDGWIPEERSQLSGYTIETKD